jgi:hypothetical protein
LLDFKFNNGQRIENNACILRCIGKPDEKVAKRCNDFLNLLIGQRTIAVANLVVSYQNIDHL